MSKGLSFEFQAGMALMAAIFWLFGLIPGVNIVTNAIYWVIWTIIFIYKYVPLIKSIAKQGVSIGLLGAKIGAVAVIAFILGEIPLISLIPWDVFANFLINRMMKQMLAKIEKIIVDAKTLAKAYDKEVGQKMRARQARQETVARQRQGEQGYEGAAV